MRRHLFLLSIITLIGLSLFAERPSERAMSYSTSSSEPDGVVMRITKADFIKNIMDFETNKTEWKFKGDKPCVVDFYADWCGPCKITAPIFDELAKEYQGKVNFYKINVDYEKELSAAFGIQGIPAFLYCPMEGKPSMTSGIAKDREETKTMFKKYIDEILLKTK